MEIITLTNILIVLTILVSLACLNDPILFNKLSHRPYDVKHKKQWYRLLTHAFVHVDYMHLIFNLFVLYSFGNFIEEIFVVVFGNQGLFFYLLLYLGGIFFSTLISMGRHGDNPGYSAVGASGTASAILYSSIIIHPLGEISLFFLPAMKSIVFGILYLVFEIYQDRKGKSWIGHDAHYMGALFGVVFVISLKVQFLTNFITSINNYLGSFF